MPPDPFWCLKASSTRSASRELLLTHETLSILEHTFRKYGFYYLSLRLWIGVWIGFFMIVLCAFEISAWVAFITRFTEENFALLIASIYVYKAIEKIIHIAQEYPLVPPEPKFNATDCFCIPPNNTDWTDLFPFNDGEAANQVGPIHWIDQSPQNCSQVHTPQNYANVGRLINEILLQFRSGTARWSEKIVSHTFGIPTCF
jgi:HCO3- transporter family